MNNHNPDQELVDEIVEQVNDENDRLEAYLNGVLDAYNGVFVGMHEDRFRDEVLDRVFD